MLCFNVAAGIGVLGVAKTMMTEIFGTTLPGIVDAEFGATYVLMISVFNLLGRFAWASVSDVVGRKNTDHVFFGLGFLLYLSNFWTTRRPAAARRSDRAELSRQERTDLGARLMPELEGA